MIRQNIAEQADHLSLANKGEWWGVYNGEHGHHVTGWLTRYEFAQGENEKLMLL